MKKRLFTGSGVAIVTPMFEDGGINYDKLGELLDFQIENQTDAIIICGTTGESSAMTDREHVECIAYTVDRVARQIPVIAGAGSNDTAYAVNLSKEAKKLGVDGLLHVTPYYNKTSQRGLIAHFTAIADATDLPVILYNVPSRTGLKISAETYRVLAGHENIVATKEASGDFSLIPQIRALCGDTLDIYSGNDDQIVPILSLGGIGVISVLANVMPNETHDMVMKFLQGDLQGSCALQVKLTQLVNALFMDVSPIPVKEAMNLMGFGVGECRLPLYKMEQSQIERLKAVLQEQHLI